MCSIRAGFLLRWVRVRSTPECPRRHASSEEPRSRCHVCCWRAWAADGSISTRHRSRASHRWRGRCSRACTDAPYAELSASPWAGACRTDPAWARSHRSHRLGAALTQEVRPYPRGSNLATSGGHGCNGASGGKDGRGCRLHLRPRREADPVSGVDARRRVCRTRPGDLLQQQDERGAASLQSMTRSRRVPGICARPPNRARGLGRNERKSTNSDASARYPLNPPPHVDSGAARGSRIESASSGWIV